MLSLDDALSQFRAALAARGIVADNIIADGVLHRADVEGKNGRKDAAYVLYLDGLPAGGFENHKDGVGWEVWRANIGRSITFLELEALQERTALGKQQREKDQQARRDEARNRAAQILRKSAPAAESMPYLRGKGIRADGVRQRGKALVIPIRDASGELQSLQFIGEDGQKRFLTGGKITGHYFGLGKPNGKLLIAEGFATAASIHEATGGAVAVAFDCGNLEPVARALRAKFPTLQLIVCGDDDSATKGNPGRTKAMEAARAVGGLVALPDFGDDRPPGATDFNDLARHLGADAVIRSLAKAKLPDIAEGQASTPSATAADPEAREWSEPQPIRAELPPVPAFDANALLPDVLRVWVLDEAERMPCAPDFVAAAVLVALGAIVGAQCAIKPKARDAWLVVPNLWGGIVALPSAKKSPAIAAAMHPVDRLAAKAAEAHRGEVDAFAIAETVYKAQQSAIEDAIKTAAKSKVGKELETCADNLRQHKANAPKPPTMRRYRTNDTTVEKVGELLRDNPAGMLIQRDELVGLLASWDREGREGDRAFYLEAWNGTNSYDTDRIGRGTIAIPNLCVSIFGGIQPDKLTEYLEQAAHALGNDGMLQRLQMLVYPDPVAWEWRDRAPDRQSRDAALQVFETLATFDPLQWGAHPSDAGQRFPYFRFDDGAQQIFIEWMHELQRERIPREQSDGHPLIAQHLAKYEKLFAALALILHLADSIATGQRQPVTAAAALRAAAWCEYLEAHARRCYGLLADGGLRGAAMLARRIQRGALDDGFTARDVRRKAWRHLSTDADVTAALEWLEGEGWIRSLHPQPTAIGRKTMRYLINPRIQKTPGYPTAKTDETIDSAVLAVPRPAVSEISSGAAHG